MKQSLTTIKEEHFGIARKIVSNMTTESWESIPHAAITFEPEVTEFVKVLKEINKDADKDTKITLNTAMLRVITEGIKACPAINAHIDFKRKLVRGTIRTFEEVNISMPMVLENGEMMTINLHDMHKKSMSEMRDTIADSARRANNSILSETMYQVSLNYTLEGLAKGHILQAVYKLIGSKTGKHKVTNLKGKAKKDYYSIPTTERLSRHDIEQGTITISNQGSICRNWKGACTLLEIIPPQVCAIGIGALQMAAFAENDGTIHAGQKLPLTIAIDHRALDMGDIVPFLNKLDEIFKNPEIIKEWV